MCERVRVLALVAALALLAGAHADYDDLEPDAPLENVVELTPDNFDKVVNGAKAALIEFYAPWCGHCKHLTPEYKKLGAAVAADKDLAERVVIAKVNADDHGELGERFRVQGFPTLKFFGRGRDPSKASAVNYNGEREADAMLAYIKKRLAFDKSFARVDALDGIAAKAGKSKKAGDLKKLAAELEAAAGKLEGADKEHGEVYVQLAKKALEKGAEWFAAERVRLERLMSSGAVGPSKIQALAAKSSVLGGFLGEEKVAGPIEEEGEEEEEEEDDGEEYADGLEIEGDDDVEAEEDDDDDDDDDRDEL